MSDVMMSEAWVQKILLKLNPETAHRIAKQLIRYRYADCFVKEAPEWSKKTTTAFGLTFPNPVGLAAGWDNDAICFDALFRMGFGFVEVGGVTPKPQSGNPKPRIFRLPEKKAIINRMGFCNAGLEALVHQLQTRKMPGILGVNIAKNKETPLERALDDYQICLKGVYPYADYVVVNISSPNTPGLRELQKDRYLGDLLQGLRIAKKSMAAMLDRDIPVLVKTTVDLPEALYEDFIQTVMDAEIDGLVVSNTTLDRSLVLESRYANETGGLSGQPLFARSIQMIKKLVEISENKIPIIGVGGILSANDARAYQEVGAALFQIFTGFVYRGPILIREIIEGLAAIES